MHTCAGLFLSTENTALQLVGKPIPLKQMALSSASCSKKCVERGKAYKSFTGSQTFFAYFKDAFTSFFRYRFKDSCFP
jgi:hypothetical protein